MSLLPTFITEQIKQVEHVTYSEPCEYGIDFKTGELTGTIVKGKEAIKVWIWICIHIERFRYPIYSWGYGSELEQYIGESLTEEYLEADCQMSIEEALKMNPFITDIEDFSVSLEHDKLALSFTVVTPYGDIAVGDW